MEICRYTCLLLPAFTYGFLLSIIPFSDACGSDTGKGGGTTKPTTPGGARGKGFNNLVGGNAREEAWASRGAGSQITLASDLTCNSFGTDCRWHNVDGPDILDYSKGYGRPAQSSLRALTSTSVTPVEPYAVAFPDEKRPPADSAFLVSDPIGCQSGDGELSFTYWTSVNSNVKVCTRRVGSSSSVSCSAAITTGDPGPAFVNIDQSNQPFEMYVLSDKFETPDDFVLVDDLEYNARLC